MVKKKLLFNEFEKALLYLHTTELKIVCKKLSLSLDGLKGALINRIIIFVKTGRRVEKTEIPAKSRAKKGIEYQLSLEELILYGSYKNDLRTRLFFKKLIGDHFHFTCFGQDWIKERWLVGNPPTYGQFAQFWQKEYEKRKKQKAQPKEEWAYLNFVKSYLKKHPNVLREQVALAWQQARAEKRKIVDDFLLKFKIS